MMMNKSPTLQQLPPEIIYNILSYLPSRDITTVASFYCRPLRNWTLVLLDERAQQSMLLGWRLMLGATTTTHHGEKKAEQDKEYVCEYDKIDPQTLDISFTVRAFGKDGFCSAVDDTSFIQQSDLVSSSPKDHRPHVSNEEILIPFGRSTTQIQASILKEKVPTKLLEFATTLPSEYSFKVQADDYQPLLPNHILHLSAAIHPNFTVKYHIYRPPDLPIVNPSELSIGSTPSDISTVTPSGISLRIDSLQLDPNWWWSQLDRHHYASFIGIEHRFW